MPSKPPAVARFPILTNAILHMHVGAVEIAFDPDQAAANLTQHGVSLAHAEQALRDSNAATIADAGVKPGQRLPSPAVSA